MKDEALKNRAIQNAKRILKTGDRITVAKCPGTKRSIIFREFDGQWIVSKSGINDYHPFNISKINGHEIDITNDESIIVNKFFQRRKIEALKERLEFINGESEEENCIVCFPEIKLTIDQIEIIAVKMVDFPKEEVFEYYRNKVNGSILLSITGFTTNEDQPDFQYIFDLGLKALSNGLTL